MPVCATKERMERPGWQWDAKCTHMHYFSLGFVI
jgi:hypothetical protein